MDWSAQQAKYGALNQGSVAQVSDRDRINAALKQTQGGTPQEKKKRSDIAKWLPTALAVGGTLAAAPFTGGTSLLGTAAILGGAAAAGGGLGELGAQGMSGEKIDIGRAGKEALISGATGAIPLGGAAKAAKAANQAGSAAATTAGREVVEQGVKKGFRGRVADFGTGLRQDVVKPKVTAGVGGAQKEAEIASRMGQVPGLSAKSKYNNLQGEMNKITTQIDPILAKSKGTVKNDAFLTGVRSNAEQSYPA